MNNTNNRIPQNDLPLKNNLSLAFILSLIVAIIMSVSSIIGIFYQNFIYLSDELVSSFAATDVVNLVICLPILLCSMWFVRKGKRIGLICWPSALFYVLYTYTPYLIAVPFGVLFLPYLLLVTLSAYTIIFIMINIKIDELGQKLADSIPTRIIGSIIIVLAIFLIGRIIMLYIIALSTGNIVDRIELGLWIADFAVGSPPMLIGGILLLKRKPLGYVAGVMLLFIYFILSFALIPIMLFQGLTSSTSIDWAGIVIVLVMAMICLIPFIIFTRHLKT